MGDVMCGVLLALGSFMLGACPFSVWVTRWRLGRDIRTYGNGNPGAANVFRAGSWKLGFVAVTLDVLKGVPFVALGHWYFGLAAVAVLAIALSAVLGHAFSPFLRFRGGKAIAVTFGVMAALPQHEILASFTLFMLLAFLFVQRDAWIVVLAAAGSYACLAIIGTGLWESRFMLCILGIFAFKHRRELLGWPGVGFRPLSWLQARQRER